MLTFEEGPHVYRYNGAVVPSVTQVLHGMVDYSRVDPAALDRAKKEGQAIHKMVELDILDELEKLPKWLDGHYAAWQKFKRDKDFTPQGTEFRMYDPRLRVAGTLDLIGDMGQFAALALIDLKRSLYAGAVIGLQLAGYKKLWNDTMVPLGHLRVRDRHALVLRANGTYKLEPFPDESDEQTFVACVMRHHWMTTHGKVEQLAA